MIVEEEGLVFDATARPADERVASFVGLCTLESGTLLCGFQLGSQKQGVTSTVRVCRSTDGGTSWQELPARFERTLDGVPGSLAMGEMVEVTPGRLMMLSTWFDRSDPERPLFDPETQGILHSKQLRAFSTDEGCSWSAWDEIPIEGLSGCSGTGPLVRFPDGVIAYPFESYKEYDDPAPARHGAWMLISRDGGKSFSERVLVARHPEDQIYYWDQRLCVGAGTDEFVALFWSHDLAQKTDLNVHFRRASLSDKNFASAPLSQTNIPGQIAAPLLLNDGRILAFVVNRTKPGTMTLWQSSDGGDTWPEKDSLIVYTHDERATISQGAKDVDFKQYWEDMGKWSFGHPVIRPLGDGCVLVTFYAGSPDCMSVRWARINVNGC